LIDPFGLCDTLSCSVDLGPSNGGGTGLGGGSSGGIGGGSGVSKPCIVQSIPDRYSELLVAGFGLPEDDEYMAAMSPPTQCGGGGGGIGSNVWTVLKIVARKVGNYIPIVCGGGLFNYGPGFRAGAGPVTVSVNPNIRIADSRSGYSEGPFTDLTVGPTVGPQGGVGYATFRGGGSETFLFGGLGFKTGVAQTSVSLFGSHVAGDPLLQNSFGINGDLGISRTGGGVGAYLNTDSLTSCVDHNFH
jgi:hypothetical protein